MNGEGDGSRLARFDPPGGLSDFDEEQRMAWSRWVSDRLDDARQGDPRFDFDGPRGQLYNPLQTPPGPDRERFDITWRAFPGRIAATVTTALDRWTLADAARDAQDEHCEWSVARDPRTGSIVRVTFTCEGPEYWEFLAATAPEKVLALYRTWVSPAVEASDLFGAHGYDRRNRWNNATTHGAMHLVHEANTTSAQIELVGSACILRRVKGRLLTGEQELIRCGKYGEPGRNSDPRIGAQIGARVRQLADVTLENPVGVYFAGLDTSGWATPDNSDPHAHWTYVRGDEAHPVRAVYEVPKDRGFTVGDITIGGRPIVFGAQIADYVSLKLNVSACRFGRSSATALDGCVTSRRNYIAALAAGTLSVEDVLASKRRSTR